MSKIKQAIATAIRNVNHAGANTYGASIYTTNQVQAILNDLLETANEDGADTGGTVLTRALVTALVGEIDDLVTNNIDRISETDIVDQDSIEMSLSGGRYSIDNLDCDKDLIATEALEDLEQTIYDWAAANDIEIEP
jgi:hypothetical protein